MKCIPMTRSARFSTAAIRVIEMDEGVGRQHDPGRTALSRRAKRSFFAVRPGVRHREIVRPVPGKLVERGERPGIEQIVDPLPGGHLALVDTALEVLVDRRDRARQKRRLDVHEDHAAA
jgi:hypothetical protein